MKVLKFIVIFIFVSCASHKNAVVDETAVIKIAERKLLSSMDREELESLQPFRAILRENNVWEVFPRDIAEFGGSIPIVYIKKKNGKVIKVTRGGNIPKEAMPIE